MGTAATAVVVPGMDRRRVGEQGWSDGHTFGVETDLAAVTAAVEAVVAVVARERGAFVMRLVRRRGAVWGAAVAAAAAVVTLARHVHGQLQRGRWRCRGNWWVVVVDCWEVRPPPGQLWRASSV